MTDKILNTVAKFHMLSRGDTVGVGLSGGADSVALTHFLSANRERLGIELKAVHIHHGIRGAEADRDLRFCEALCREMCVEFITHHADIPKIAGETGESIEECARRVRYDFFEKSGCDKFATAHNLGDNIETFLLNLARGSALSGLCGIPYTRGIYIRPLLDCTRDEIEEYIARNSLSFVTDSTNLSDDYARNRVRHKIAPRLYEMNPAFERAFLKCVESLRLANDFINEQAQVYIERSERNGYYDCAVLKNCCDALKFQIIDRILKDENAKNISREHILAVADIIEKGGKASVGGGITVVSEQGRLFFKDIPAQPYFEKKLDLSAATAVTPWADYGIYILFKKDLQNLNKDVLDNLIDCDKISNVPLLRNRRDGDKIRLGGRSVTKTLKKLFNESRIPAAERSRRAIVSDSGGIVWLEGFGVCERCRPDEATERFMLVKRGDTSA